jgi:hypothetical protein
MNFAVDCLTFISPNILLLTVFGTRITEFYILTLLVCLFVAIVVLLCGEKITTTFISFHRSVKFNDQKVSETNLEIKLIKLSINAFRTTLFVIVCISILATDFKIFDNGHRKTQNFGISLMDLGVGMFTICHSLKVIRNSKNGLIKESAKSFLK